jgi:PKD repeat protein
VENITPNSFTSAQRSDFYQICPNGYADPFTGQTSGLAYFVGYFLLNPGGTMTFTRAAATAAAPVAGFSGAPMTGFAPLHVTFTDASTGSITNWLWSFGDGQSVTNTTSVSVHHTYAAGGSYTVSLTVKGPGGSNTSTQTAYVVASPPPQITTVTLSGTQLVFGGNNCPPGVGYRILTSTDVALALATWTPVQTNTFPPSGSFSYTNSTTRSAAFFRLVSP